MGDNRVGFGIINDDIVKGASKQEIIRRYFKTICEYKKGYIDKDTANRARLIMEELNLKESDRKVVTNSREYSLQKKLKHNKNDIYPVVSLELDDGTIINGRESDIMDAPAAVILNSIKHLANINDDIHLISPVILEPIQNLKINTLGIKNTILNCEEILIALKYLCCN